MAKIGQLLLREGRWQDEEIVPADYVRDATKAQVTFSEAESVGYGTRYGYQIWVEDERFSALGIGGHTIVVVPKLDLVIVTKAMLSFDAPSERELVDGIVASVGG